MLLPHLRCTVVCSDIVHQKSSLQQIPLCLYAFYEHGSAFLSENNRILFIVSSIFQQSFLKSFAAIFLKKKKKKARKRPQEII